jgi:hypothetical protein
MYYHLRLIDGRFIHATRSQEHHSEKQYARLVVDVPPGTRHKHLPHQAPSTKLRKVFLKSLPNG